MLTASAMSTSLLQSASAHLRAVPLTLTVVSSRPGSQRQLSGLPPESVGGFVRR